MEHIVQDHPDYLLYVEGASKHFPIGNKKVLKAVDNVSFGIKKGETFGLVGESGCGKSTLSRIVLQLTQATSGSVMFMNEELTNKSRHALKPLRKQMQVVFQDPYDSINPRMTLRQVVEEPMVIHKVDKTERDGRLRQLFTDVGLPVKLMERYPHQLSGGQRQRLCIARSLALSPKMLVLDEAVSALDVSIQAQILNLMLDLKEEHGLTYLFISHNLSVVKFISDTIAVMYFGKIVELAPKNELFHNCQHPYTAALLSAVPVPDPRLSRERMLLEGDVPNLYTEIQGCIFQDRCPHVQQICKEEAPAMRDINENHRVACHFACELPLRIDWGEAP